MEYHLKFRFLSQIYNKSYHKPLSRHGMADLGAGPQGYGAEFDVPKCAEGVMGCARRADGTWVHTITGTYTGTGSLVAAHWHCHAPTCLSMAMYKCDKSVKVCNATTGELLCKQEPIYGGRAKSPTRTWMSRGSSWSRRACGATPSSGLSPRPRSTDTHFTV